MGIGFGVMIMIVMIYYYFIGFVKGGSGDLFCVLVDCIEDYGGEVRLGIEVNSVIVESGWVVGLCVIFGEEFCVKDVVVVVIYFSLFGDFVEGLDIVMLVCVLRVKVVFYILFKVDVVLNKLLSVFVGNFFDEVFGIVVNIIYVINLIEFFENFEFLWLGCVNIDNLL